MQDVIRNSRFWKIKIIRTRSMRRRGDSCDESVLIRQVPLTRALVGTNTRLKWKIISVPKIIVRNYSNVKGSVKMSTASNEKLPFKSIDCIVLLVSGILCSWQAMCLVWVYGQFTHEAGVCDCVWRSVISFACWCEYSHWASSIISDIADADAKGSCE